MKQVTEEVPDRKAAGYRYRHSQWTQLNTSGNSPTPRSGHDVVVIGNKAYLFGGCGGEQVRYGYMACDIQQKLRGVSYSPSVHDGSLRCWNIRLLGPSLVW